MLRRALVQRGTRAITRALYVPARTRQRPKNPELEEFKKLDLKLKDIRQQEIQLRSFLKQAEEKETVERLEKHESLKLAEAPAPGDIKSIEDGFDTEKYAQMFSPVASIQQRVGNSLVTSSRDNLETQIQALQSNDGFANLPLQDVQKFIEVADLKKNAHLTAAFEQMARDAGLCSPSLTHSFMAGYSSLGNVAKVQELAQTVKQNPVVYGHLAKAHFKCRNLDGVTGVIRQMEAAGLKPTLPIYTMVLQTLVQHSKLSDAFTLFDNLKYLSAEHQPDVGMYNTMLLAASKIHNVNKVLDLYQEMTTRPIDPLEPNEETLNLLVYACSRDDKTRMAAWDYFLQLRQSTSRNKALFYLCGQTGELVLLRKLVAQLCASPQTWPDDFMLNCLFLGYLNYDATKLSVLSGSLGNRLRAEIFTPETSDEPPFLPVDQLTNEMVYAEARAMLEFFGDRTMTVANRASASVGVPILFNMLKIAKERGTLEQFQECWDKFTRPCEGIVTTGIPHRVALERDQHIYKLGIQAAAAFHSGELADAVWRERGQWRKLSSFASLPPAKKKRQDVVFAKEMVAFFVSIGDSESALGLVKSTMRQFRWRRHHLEPLLELAAKQEDFDTVLAVRNLLRRYWEKENA